MSSRFKSLEEMHIACCEVMLVSVMFIAIIDHRFHQDVFVIKYQSVVLLNKCKVLKENELRLTLSTTVHKNMHVKHREGITCHTQDILYFAFPIFFSLWSHVLQAQDSLQIICKY